MFPPLAYRNRPEAAWMLYVCNTAAHSDNSDAGPRSSSTFRTTSRSFRSRSGVCRNVIEHLCSSFVASYRDGTPTTTCHPAPESCLGSLYTLLALSCSLLDPRRRLHGYRHPWMTSGILLVRQPSPTTLPSKRRTTPRTDSTPRCDFLGRLGVACWAR